MIGRGSGIIRIPSSVSHPPLGRTMNPRTPAVRVAILLSLAAFLHPGAAIAQFKALETDHLRLIYEPTTQSFLVPHATRCLANAIRFYEELFDFVPSERVTVILNDFSDAGHGAALTSPWNTLIIAIAPISYAFETYPATERMYTLMNHEMCHIAALDRSTGLDSFARSVFGGKVRENAEHPESIIYSYLTTPRKASPRWYHEGIAVFLETWMAGGVGRAQGAYDEMVFRSMVRDGRRFYDPLGLASEGTKVDFQAGANSYLYGTRFMSYLANEYSPESVIRWVARTPGTSRSYSGQFKRVYGRSIDDVWDDWIAWEHDFQRTNLESIRVYPTTPSVDISDRALGSVSRAYVDADAGELYVAANFPGEIAHLAAISLEDGSSRKICNIKGPTMYTVTSLARDPDTGTLFFTTDNNDWRDLRSVDPQTGTQKVLLKDARIGDLAFSRVDHSLLGIRHFNGISTLVRIPSPYENWYQIHSWPYGTDVYDLDVSPDGKLLSASVAEITGQQSLQVFELEKFAEGEFAPLAEQDLAPSIPSNFVFTADGRHLVGSSYYTGASNIFRWCFYGDSLDALSNCETGFFRPIPVGADSLIVFRYTGDGFIPAKIEARVLEDVSATNSLGYQVVSKYPVVRSWNVGSPLSVDLDSIVVSDEDYHSFRSVRPTSVYPIVEGYGPYAAYGLYTSLTDPLFLNRGSLSATYSPEDDLDGDERLHIEADWERMNWRATFSFNDADFYDLFGPTKVGRKGLRLGVDYSRTLIYDVPKTMKLSVGVTGYDGLDHLPLYQNVETSSDEMLTYYARLNYKNDQFSLGAVDYERGVQWGIVTGGTYLVSDLYPRVRGDLDFGFPFLLGHSSVWFRNSAGVAFGDRNEPSANYYFGGFGNNWVDRGPIKRFRRHYAFAGAELNEVFGQTYGKSLIEWNLPPLRFRRLGKPSFYATWARLALFAGGIVTDPDDDPNRRWVSDVGAQLDVRFTVFANQSLTFSAGYARAYEKSTQIGDEFMFSLKIL